MDSKRYSLGVDYGTNSVRALIVDVATGEEVATSVFPFPSGDHGVLLDERDPNLARQNPADHIEGFYASVQGALKEAAKIPGFSPDKIVGIGVDTTGSSPMPLDAHGMPLGMDPRFTNNLNAQMWLWKDHTSHAEAAEITQKAREQGLPYLAKCGGTYSSEWFWSKILHCSRVDPAVFDAASSWCEHSDFMPAYLTGTTAKMARNICAAGHKAMYADQWGGLPSVEFLRSLSPKLGELRERLYDCAEPASTNAGPLAPDVAQRAGLPVGIPVAVGLMDAHAGAVASGAKPGTLVKIIGTSTCDCMVHPGDQPIADIPGVCGIVPGSIVPGMIGIEAGQSAVGDIFNWFVTNLCPPSYAGPEAHEKLSAAAARLRPGESGLVALDWNNGNRTVLVDPLLTGLLVGQTLHTTAPEIYRALIEATAFGALTIIKRIEQYGVRIDEVVNCGGIAEKSPLVMQIYADVCNRPMKVARAQQACAVGAAVFGAVVGGAYKTTEEAQAAMAGVREQTYQPNAAAVATYAGLYKVYRDLHDAFGMTGFSGSLQHVMKELISIRDEARGRG